MEIVNFFEKLAGRWFSQRTTHALTSQQSKAGKSDLEVAFLAADAPEVQALYQKSRDNQGEPLCGLKIQQSSTIDGDPKPKVMTLLLVPLKPEPHENGGDRGILLRSGAPSQSKSTYTYTYDDEVLTIASEDSGNQSEERLWFINDNLRMRTGITELADGLRIASFCSEIRMGVKPPQESPKEG
ncbi:MAG: phycobiliprotein lyase [Phormidesmis sp.]